MTALVERAETNVAITRQLGLLLSLRRLRVNSALRNRRSGEQKVEPR